MPKKTDAQQMFSLYFSFIFALLSTLHAVTCQSTEVALALATQLSGVTNAPSATPLSSPLCFTYLKKASKLENVRKQLDVSGAGVRIKDCHNGLQLPSLA